MVLAFSILMSLKTVLLSNINLVKDEKEKFLPFKGKVLIFLSTTFFTIGRVGSILLYFAPSLGQMDLLHHWKNEQTPYKPASVGPWTKGSNLTIHNFTIPWSHVERQSPPYTHYTGLGLLELYIIMIITMGIHVAVVYAWKSYCSSPFR